MIVVTHSISGITFRTETNTWLPILQDDPFERFVIEDMSPDVRHYIRKIGHDTANHVPLSTDEQRKLGQFRHFSSAWLNNPVLRSQEVRKRLKHLSDSSEEKEVWIDEHQVCIRDFSRNRLDIYFTEKLGGYVEERSAYLPEYHVASNFKQIFSTFLPYFSALLIHASGVILGDRAALFLAPNEGGKTTVMALSNGEPILSGDQLVLRKEGNGIIAHGSPLGGITSGSCQAKVGGLFMLERGSDFGLEPVQPAELVQCLWTEHQNYTFFLPQRLKKRAFQILSDACHQAPVYMMRFQKHYVDWDAIDSAMV